MGIGDYANDESSNDDDEQKISYIYMYGPDHKKGSEQAFPQAYPLTKSGGLVRRTFKNGALSDKYGNIHGYMSHVIYGLGQAIESNSYDYLFDTLFVDDEVIFEYLQDNPEVRSGVIKRMNDANKEQKQQDQDGQKGESDDEPQEADD